MKWDQTLRKSIFHRRVIDSRLVNGVHEGGRVVIVNIRYDYYENEKANDFECARFSMAYSIPFFFSSVSLFPRSLPMLRLRKHRI